VLIGTPIIMAVNDKFLRFSLSNPVGNGAQTRFGLPAEVSIDL
jgi:hypothetical protein